MSDGQPPSRGFAGLGHRQGVAWVLLTLAAELNAWHLLVPRLQQRVASGTLAAADATDSAAASTGGPMLAVLGGALLACTLYNRFARVRARRPRGRSASHRVLDLTRPSPDWPPTFIRSKEPRLTS
jgi:hypothetical protein